MTNKKLDWITDFNANSGSFDFLEDEPELYSISDLKKKTKNHFQLKLNANKILAAKTKLPHYQSEEEMK